MTNRNIAWDLVNKDIAEAVESIETAHDLIDRLADVLSDRIDTEHFQNAAKALYDLKYKVRGLRG